VGLLKDGAVLNSEHRIAYKVVRYIAAGGQGEVYEVEDGAAGRRYALKWYFKHAATPYQRKTVERLIKRGAPDARFLWPLDMIVKDGLFGYVMRLRPPLYKSVVDLMKRRTEPTFASLCMAAINLADGYQSLHSAGLCYRDISFGNLFFDPGNGDVLICDNDNVTVNMDDKSGTNGTPRFIAPEIIIGNVNPSTATDLYSMAVLLFYMFMMHHPLEGERESKIRIFDGKAMEKIYGREPLFIWHPTDRSNRPVPGYQDNAIIFWKIYPEFLRGMFVKAFTEGLNDPGRRVVEKQWKDTFAQLRNSIMYCSKCGSENFYEAKKNKPCWQCGAALVTPPIMQIGGQMLMLNHDTKIMGHHTKNDFDFINETGQITQHPTNKDRWGVKNTGVGNWTFIKPGGETAVIEPGRTAPLIVGAKVGFGQSEGTII